MKSVGDKFPQFKLKAVVSSDMKNAFQEISFESYKGKWLVVFSWPKDFTFVCPTEIVEFGKVEKEFAARNAQLLGGSTDSEFVHLAWRNDNKQLSNLPFPMLADVKRELVSQLGIVDQVEGVAQRATFIVDPDGVLKYMVVSDLNVGRSVEETLRVLKALQTGGLCPIDWKPGQATLNV